MHFIELPPCRPFFVRGGEILEIASAELLIEGFGHLQLLPASARGVPHLVAAFRIGCQEGSLLLDEFGKVAGDDNYSL